MIILQKDSFWINYWKTSPLNYIDAFKMQEKNERLRELLHNFFSLEIIYLLHCP
jgi:hypothetical protein